MPVTWDKSKAFYRDGKGKEVPYQAVRGSVEAVADHTKLRLRELTQSFIDKKIDLPSWATQSEQLIRKSLISSGQIASGGKAQLDASLNGRLGSLVRFHLTKFREMGLSRERGEVSGAALLARSEMYGDSSVGVFEQMRVAVMKDAGFTKVKNILGSGDPCTECPAITAKGFMPLEDFKPPGTRLCLSRCKCSAEYE
jgi:hypothetical protein